MRIIVVNTGTELLLGDVLNTHLQFIAHQVLPLGLRVSEQRTIADGPAIGETLSAIFPKADLVFVTGGLGPTSDDITREQVADSLKLELVENVELRESIRSRLAVRRIPAPPSIWRQARVPTGGQVLPNAYGTAPGIYLRKDVSSSFPSPHLFLLPGPPRELEPMFVQSVFPILRTLVGSCEPAAMRTFRLAAIGESAVEHKIGAALAPITGLEVGYCARPGEVDVRFIGSPKAVATASEIITAKLGSRIFTSADESLASVIIRLLSKRRETVTLAESCTGGLLAHKLTNVAGASNVFLAGFVAYSNDEKVRALGVARELIEQHGAVSEPVARQMAHNAREQTGATYALSTTGIAGPGGGDERKPVGTVFVALASPNQNPRCEKFFFPSDRETFKELVAQHAFELLRHRLA